MKLETILRPWPWLFAFLALACHFLIQWNFLSLPLSGDEGYYANPEVMTSLWNWPEYSFGHPPGWHYIHALVFTIMDLSAEAVRSLGLFFSTLFLISIFVIGWFRKQLLAASVLMLMIAGHEYVRDFGSFNFPVIATALFGFSALFLADHKKWLAFSVALTMAVFIRESALAFVVASLFFIDSKKNLKFVLAPAGFFALTYIWYFASKGGLLLNKQVDIMVKSGETPFTFTLEKLSSHIHLILQLFPAGFLVLALVGVPLILLSSKRAEWSPLTSALLTVFTLHTLFFGFYTELGYRVTFVAAMALAFLVYHWTESQPDRPNVKPLILLLAGVVTAFQLINWSQSQSPKLLTLKDEAQVHRAMVGLLEPLILSNEDLIIVTTNPYHEYLTFPWHGYTSQPIVAHWYGGSPGYMKLRDFDVGIVHQPLDWWPEQDIYNYAQDNNFELYHEVEGSKTKVQLWVRPGIKP